MKLRRVVIATEGDNGGVVVEDGPPPRMHDWTYMPGFSQALVWATPSNVTLSETNDPTPGATTMLPEPSGTRFIVLTFPPDSIFADPSFDGAAAGAESLEHSPGIAELFEPESPGMHTTPTVDYNIVIDGEVWLALSGDREVKLSAGDVVVQHGVRHAWRNKSDKPATIAAILIGADR
jgi:hypothetical protein